MDSPKANLIKVIALLTPIVILPFALADEMQAVGEDYYGNDIHAAILDANRYWYNRTTERSFALPKLPSKDLEATSLEGAIGVTAAGPVSANPNSASDLLPPTELTENNRNLKDANQPPAAQTEAVKLEKSQFTPLIQHDFSQGTMSVQGTVASGTITSTPRP